jgi:hypothetical protein
MAGRTVVGHTTGELAGGSTGRIGVLSGRCGCPPREAIEPQLGVNGE